MADLSIGKIRGLQQLASSKGIFVMCAMDHRGSLMKMLDEEHPQTVSYQTMVNYKLDLCQALAEHSSAVLLDPLYGAAQAIASGVLPAATGLLVSVEATGYAGDKETRITELLLDWSVEKVKRMGGTAVKLLLYYRPDLAEISTRQLSLVKQVADDCMKADIPFLLEPVSYSAGEGEKDPSQFAKVKPKLVIETAKQVTTLGIDVLKAEFPAEFAYESNSGRLLELCRQLDEASRVPWVILSAGVDYEIFSQQVEIACKAGASGFLAGRALWQEATDIRSRRERMKFLESRVTERLDHLAGVASMYGKPWYAKLELDEKALTPIAEGWYRSY